MRRGDADALYAFKSRGFGGETGVVCLEKLRAGYTTAYPAQNTGGLLYLFTPCHYIQFPGGQATGTLKLNRVQRGRCPPPHVIGYIPLPFLL